MKKNLIFKFKFARNLALMLLLFVGFNFSVIAQKGAGVVNCYGRLQVSNAHVCAEDGTQISLAGMSFFWSNWAGSYYEANTVNYLVDEFQVSLVRAAYGVPHEGSSDGDWSKIERVVDAAIARDIYVIIDWHTEGDAWNHETEARNFFSHFSAKYGNNPHVIYELWNEPISSGVTSLRNWCQTMADVIRVNDPDNLVICGSDTWSQYPNSYSINDPNAAYTFHGYFDDPANGANHRSQFYNNVQAAMNMGNAVFVTEFGANYGSTGGSAEIMAACRDMGISMAAWSVNDKVEPWSIFNGFMGSLTSIGNFYRDQMRNWSTASCMGPSGCEIATPSNVPAKIEAEDYCNASGIQTEPCDEGGENVGYIAAGDWMKYKIDVPSTATYTIEYRVASESGSAGLQVANNTLAVPNTGGWQNWVTVSHDVVLQAGVQELTITAVGDGWNINWFEIQSSGPQAPIANAGIDQTLVDTDMSGTETITLDGSASTDPDGTIVSYTWKEGSTVIGNAAVITVEKAISTSAYVFTLEVEDNDGLTDTDDVAVIVKEDNSGDNMIINGEFANDANWVASFYETGSGSVSFNGQLHAAISNGGTDAYMVQIIQGGLNIESGTTYTLSFDASAAASRAITCNIEKDGSPWTNYGGITTTVGTSTQNVSLTFTSNESDNNARIAFNLGSNNADVYIDNVVLSADGGTNQVPIAVVGADQSLPSGSTSTNLDGSGSYDPDNAPSALTYTWSQTAGSSITISNTYVASPSILGLTDGNSYTFQLVVFDGADYSTSSSIVVTVDNGGGESVFIEAENYTYMSGIQTENCSEGGLNVGWTDAGDWMTYEGVNIPTSGIYTVEYRVASQNGGGSIKLEQNAGTILLGQIDVPVTGGWQNWITISHTVTLSAGVQGFGIGVAAGGFNLNWIQFISTGLKSASSDNSFASVATEMSIYPNPVENMLFIEVSEIDMNSNLVVFDMTGKQIIIQEVYNNQMQVDVSTLESGVYMIRVNNNTKRFLKK